MPPLIFGTKVAAAGTLLTQVEALAQKQTRATTGTTEDKAREEQELEDICFALGNAMVDCCLDAGNAAGAAPFRLSITAWRELLAGKLDADGLLRRTGASSQFGVAQGGMKLLAE